MNHSIWKILFVLGAYEYLERQEGKIRKCLFFYVKIFKNNSVRGVQVATDSITTKPYILQKIYFIEFVANVLRNIMWS